MESSFHQKKGLTIKVTTMDLHHTNCCVPSPELLRRQVLVVTIAWDRMRDVKVSKGYDLRDPDHYLYLCFR